MVETKWQVLGEAERTPRGLKQLRVVCTCGNERVITEDSYKRGLSKSCGCWRVKSRHSRGLSGKPTPTYISWQSMRTRCLNPHSADYSYYGGRGVAISKDWDSFEVFLRDMGERPDGMTLDRIDCNGDYSASNCRWADNITQRANQRPHKRSVRSV